MYDCSVYVPALVHACVPVSGFVWAITSTFMHGFEVEKCHKFEIFFSDGLTVQVTLDGQVIKWS